MNDDSGLQQIAFGVAEAACLFAILSIPLYFSVLTQGAYEPDKAVLLRILAILAGGGWLIGTLTTRSVERRGSGDLIVWLAGLLFVSYTLSTILSIDPSTSLWGSHGRQQGLLTRAAYLIFLLVVVTRFRLPERRERLVTVLLFGSIPAVVYGIAQQLGFDPIPSSGDPNTLFWPVRSTFGQHIFFGSYLILVIPFTAGRLLQNWPDRRQRGADDLAARAVVGGVGILALTILTFFLVLEIGIRRPALFLVYPGVLAGYTLLSLIVHRELRERVPGMVRAAGYGALLLLQVAALLFTGARGSWLGFFVSAVVFVWLWAYHLRRIRLLRVILLGSAVFGLFLLLLNLPNGPLEPLRSVHGLNRLANITDSGGAGGSGQGRILIWQGVKQLMTTDPSIGNTWGGAGRDVVGYGPESLHWAFQAVYPLKLRRATSEIWTWDRAHNIYLDTLVDGGLIALLLFGAVIIAFFCRVVALLRAPSTTSSMIVVAAASSVAGHLVDGIFGLDTAVSLLLMWVAIGVVAGYRLDPVREEVVEPQRRGLVPAAGWSFGIVGVLAIAFAVVPPSSSSPAWFSISWIIVIIAGLGVIAGTVGGFGSWRISVGGKWNAALLGAVALIAALAIGSQMRFETAAIAEQAGLEQLTLGNPLSALGYLEEARSANQYDPQYATDLGSGYLSIASTHTDSSDPAFTPVPTDTMSLSASRANGLGSDQLLTLSEYALQAAHNLSPLDPDTDDNLGNLYVQWNRPDQAIQEYSRAELLSPNNPRYLDRLALAELQLDHPAIARARARSALDLDTSYWYSHYTLALVDQKLGSTGAAKQEAALALGWMRNYWPSPPPQQIAQLQSLEQQG